MTKFNSSALTLQSNPEKNIAPVHNTRKTLLNVVVFVGKKVLYATSILLVIIVFSFFGIKLSGGMDWQTAIVESLSDTVAYLSRLLTGSMGMTTAGSATLNQLPVEDVIKKRLIVSLALIGLAILLSSIVGLYLGTRAARNRTKSSLYILIVTIIGVSIPSFFAAFLLQWGVTSITSITGKTFLPVGGFGWDSHLILPVLVLSARPIAQITRIVFISLCDVLRQDYIRTAYSKGLRSWQVTLHHMFRNAAIPILTTIGMSLRFALSSLPIVEIYFGINGVGSALLKGIAQQDADLTVGLTLCFGTIFILVNLFLELSYRLIDPRLWETPKTVSHRHHHKNQKFFVLWRDNITEFFTNNSVSHWLRQRNRIQETNPFSKTINQSDRHTNPEPHIKTERKFAWRNLLRNVPFIVGSILVIGLIIVVIFGLNISPKNPYNTEGLARINDVLKTPPFEPSTDFIWGSDPMGRDIMSLILTGAQMTLTLATLAVTARLLLGTALGMLAGWRNGHWLDRVIVGFSEIISAFPTLILTMILVLAIGIRQGTSTFILALSLVGWGEIMQYIRGETITIRPKAYIESAVAMGAHSPRIILKHVFPQLVSALISLAALEMSSVLLLLGELGFISIFIGGGAFIELPGVPAALYSDVPEWGALLSNVRYYSRSYPWVALYPMLAFFISILSFNLLGEGIRRLVDSGTLIINRIFNKYTLVGIIALVLAIFLLQTNSGRWPFLREYAETFDGERAITHIVNLTLPEMSGRALGTAGQDLAADYMAAQFEVLGLQAAGQSGSYFQTRSHSYEYLLATPQLTIHDGGAALVYGKDYAAYPGRNTTAGEADGALIFVGLGQPQGISAGGFYYNSYLDLVRSDFSQNILLVLSEWEADILTNVEKEGLLVVTDDPNKLTKAYTYSGQSGRQINRTGEETPMIWITEATANRLLARSDTTVADLRKENAQLGLNELRQQPLNAQVSMSVAGEIVKKQPVRHVIGFWPGNEGYEFCNECMDRQLIVVMAQLDAPPLLPMGGNHPGANDNASGMAVMLETIRIMKETGYQPSRSIMFIAFNGEGFDGGEPVSRPDIKRFLQAKTSFATIYQPEAIIYLRGVGAGDGSRLEVSAAGSLRLADLFETAARHMDVKTTRAEEIINIGLIYDGNSRGRTNADAAPIVTLSWEGWEKTARTSTDTPKTVSSEILEETGRALSLALMTLGEERTY